MSSSATRVGKRSRPISAASSCAVCARIGGDDLPEELGGAAAAAPAEHVQPVGAGDLVDAAADRGGIDELVNNAALSEELGPKKRVSLGPASYTFDTRARFLATPADEFEPAIAEQWENNKAQLRQQLAN